MQEYDTIHQRLQARYDEIQTRLQKIRRDVQHKNEPLQSEKYGVARLVRMRRKDY